MNDKSLNQEIPQEPTKQNRGRKRVLFIILGVALLACCGIFALASLFSPSSRNETPVAELGEQTSRADEVIVGADQVAEESLATSTTAQTVQATATAPSPTSEPTATPRPTNTPQPTSTVVPTATQNPNLVRPGTHLVGTDIEPGIYRGEAGTGIFESCYWARLKDVTGNFDALLANSNSVGQFYVEVLESDYALETACELVPLDSIPELAGAFPATILPGMYIVGRDIGPGTYRGEAGADVLESCYWARLSNVSGGFDGLLANNNSNGQYFVQVLESDFALETACELELVQ